MIYIRVWRCETGTANFLRTRNEKEAHHQHASLKFHRFIITVLQLCSFGVSQQFVQATCR